MRCPHCNTENEKNAIFCTNCNAWILGTIYEEETPVASETPAPAEAAAKEKKKPNWPKLAIGAAMAVLLLGVVILLWPAFPLSPETSNAPLLNNTVPGVTTLPPATGMPVHTLPAVSLGTLPPVELIELPNYTTSRGAITAAAHNGTMHFIVNNNAMQTDIPEDSLWSIRLSKDLSGTHGAYLDQEGNLYYINGISVTLLNTGVVDYRLSAGGKRIAYQIDGGLHLFETDTGIGYGTGNVQPLSFCVSPNGEYLAYLIHEPLEGNKPYALIILTVSDAKRFRLFDAQVTLLAISDDGNTIYVQDRQRNLLAVSGTGEVTELGTLGSTDLMQISLPFLSSDHRQMLYYTSEGTYLSIDGQPGQLLSARHLTPVAPEGTSIIGGVNGTITFPGDSLLGVVYSATNYDTTHPAVSYARMITDLLYVSSGGNLTVLENNVSEYHAVSSVSLFYTTETKRLYTVNLLTGNKQELRSNAETFTVSLVGEYLYYMMDDMLIGLQTDDMTLSNCLGEFENPQLYIAQNEILCVWDGNKLSTFTLEGGAHLQTFTGVESCESHSSGMVYVTTADGIYSVSSTGRLTQVLIYDPEATETPDIYLEPIENEG